MTNVELVEQMKTGHSEQLMNEFLNRSKMFYQDLSIRFKTNKLAICYLQSK